MYEEDLWSFNIWRNAGEYGTIHEDRNEIGMRLREKFSELLNQDIVVNGYVISKTPQLESQHHLSEPLTPEVVSSGYHCHEIRKSSRPGWYPAELYKCGGHQLKRKLLNLFQLVWESETILADLREANILTMLKKGDRAKCDNYHSILLLSIAGNILTKIIFWAMHRYQR